MDTHTRMRKLLVTSALPYANGQIHLGHLVEYIQTDIFVRYQKLIGNTCYYMCADDTHGTPIVISAKQQNITPEALIASIHKDHVQDFKAFNINFDHYGSTNSEENRCLAEEIFLKAKEKGAIYEKEIEQYYSEADAMFLPDRFIKGTCPKCKTEDQYGDSCESCGATYAPTDLINPKSTLSGAEPILKKSTHYFFELSQFSDPLQTWINNEEHLKPELQNKLQEWFKTGLQDWDISRDGPYFGFKIPGTTDKYFYVWLDAPVGYIATTQKWCRENDIPFEPIWKNNEFEIHHFIGKDILYFHALFWPAMLMVSEYSLPQKLHVHGFLTINGEKMSKSRGTFITARHYLEKFSPEFLRYYYAAKLSGSIEDIDLNMEDFIYRVNSDIVNKVVNIGSRLGSIVTKKLDAKLTTIDKAGHVLLDEISAEKDAISACYESLDYAKAMRTIMSLADKSNKYIDENAPWSAVKDSPEQAAIICTTGLNALRLLTIYLKPVMPELTQKIEAFLNIPTLTWQDVDTRLQNHAIQPYEHLAQRIVVGTVL